MFSTRFIRPRGWFAKYNTGLAISRFCCSWMGESERKERNRLLCGSWPCWVTDMWPSSSDPTAETSTAEEPLPSTLCTLTTVVHPDTIQSFSLFAVQIRGLFPVMLQENQQQNNIKSYSFREFFVGHKKRKRISSYIVLGRRGRWRKRSRNQGQLQTCDL
jgi:hypothetical protein